MPKRTLLMLAAVMVLSGSATVESWAQKTSEAKEPPLAKDSLYERAKKAGGKLVFRYAPSRGVSYANVEELARRSDLIVVGRALSHKSRLTKGQKLITQDFLVKVQEVIKGDLPRGQAVLVSVPGGTYRFPDGTFAAMMPDGYKLPEDGGLYVFFLRAKEKDDAYLGQRLVSDSQGLFALREGKVEPSDMADKNPLNLKYRKMGPAAFLDQIHKAVPRRSAKD